MMNDEFVYHSHGPIRETKAMTRDEAIRKADNAIAGLTPGRQSLTSIGAASSSVAIIAALEALGLVKFEVMATPAQVLSGITLTHAGYALPISDAEAARLVKILEGAGYEIVARKP